MKNMEASSFIENMSLKLYGFCQNQLFCDTLILVENQSDCKKTFWAHSVVLAASSADLCDEFLTRSDFTHNGHAVRFCLPLPDCDPVAVEVVLRYLYTGKLVAPSVFHEPKEIAKIFEVCKSLGVPLEKLNGVQLTFSNRSSSISQVVDVCSESSTSKETVQREDVTLQHVDGDTVVESVNGTNDQHISTLDTDMDESLLDSSTRCSAAASQSAVVQASPLDESSFSLQLSNNDVADSNNVLPEVNKCKNSLSKTSFKVNLKSRVPSSKGSKFGQQEVGRAKRPSSSGRPCNRCGIMISPSWRLLDHQRKCDRMKAKLACANCTATFAGRGPLREHQRVVHGVHCCRKCDRQFQSAADLDDHRQNEHSIAAVTSAAERPYVCDVCGKSFCKPPILVQHINAVHNNGARPFLCDLCGASFSSGVNLRHHIDGHNRPYACDRCGRGFRARHILEEHVLACQTGNSQPFQCNVCGVRFTARNNLRRHELSHRGHSVCAVCGRSYRHKQSLDEHMRLSHRPGSGRADPANRCSICGKVFARLKFLEKHALQHQQQDAKRSKTTRRADSGGAHVCAVCGRGFSHPRFLANHSFVHQQHKLLKCGTCGKEFTHRRYLTMHALVHREVKYACPVDGCSKQFPFLAHVIKHASHVHGMSREVFQAASSLRVEQNDENNVTSCEFRDDGPAAVECTVEVSDNNGV